MVWASEMDAKERASLAIVGRQSVADFDWRNIVDVHMLPFLEELEGEL